MNRKHSWTYWLRGRKAPPMLTLSWEQWPGVRYNMAQAGQVQGGVPAAHAPHLTLPEFNGQSGETTQFWY